MTLHRLELEVLGDAEKLLKGYDQASDTWNFPPVGDFWEAVRHAHEIGRQGEGRHVAIIDSGCDLTIPRLERQAGKVRRLVESREAKTQRHGTAVAMLISEVAPKCTLDIYSVVADDGSLNEAATIAAIAEAAASDATVINLSFGKCTPWTLRADTAARPPLDPRARKRVEISESDPCPLCQAASQAAEAGKLVFAAVGNNPAHAYCPARAENVVAVGFQALIKTEPVPDKEIFSLIPAATQSIHADLMLLGPPDALGSSFACPLYAGVAALGLTQAELWSFIASYSARVEPMQIHAAVDTTGGGVANAPRDLIETIDHGYWQTVSSIPHAHSEVQSQRFPELPRSDPDNCPFCGILANPQYVNAGYWLFSTKRPREAIDLLQAARKLCPWDARPVAFEGSAHYVLGRLDKAIANYELALKMRPGYRPYIDALATIRLEGRQRVGILGPTRLPLLPEAAAMSFVELTRFRHRVTRKMNTIYYTVTTVLLALHLAFPTSAWTRWLLLIPVLAGLLWAAQAFSDSKVARLQPQGVPDYPKRREVYALMRLLQVSAICYFLAALGLIYLVLFS